MLTNTVLKIEVDQDQINQMISEKIADKINSYSLDKVFYDMNDLTTITSFSRGHIYNTFFYDSRFTEIRRKVGNKHVFPVKETNEFLLQWIKEQPTD